VEVSEKDGYGRRKACHQNYDYVNSLSGRPLTLLYFPSDAKELLAHLYRLSKRDYTGGVKQKKTH